MTQVLFAFKHPNGEPLAGATFTVRLQRSGFIFETDGVVVPETLTFVTGADGTLLAELEPSSTPYLMVVLETGTDDDDECCSTGGKAIRYKFYVPDSDSVVRAQDLYLAPVPNSEPWDETALQMLTDAKIAALDAATRAKVSEQEALAARDAAEGFAISGLSYLEGSQAAAIQTNQDKLDAASSAGQAASSLAAVTAIEEDIDADLAIIVEARDITVAAKDLTVTRADEVAQNTVLALDARDASEAFAISGLGYLQGSQAAALQTNQDLLSSQQAATAAADQAALAEQHAIEAENAANAAAATTEVLRDELAEQNNLTGGAGQIGWDGDTVGTQLNLSKKMGNYTALRNYSGTATRVVITKAGIAGDFYPLSTGADNNGTIIVDALGRPWGRRYSGTANVLWFGVVAGEADSTPGIQAAIDACKKVYIPDGTYNIDGYKGSQTSYVNGRRGGLWLYEGVSITGQSRLGTVLKNISDNSTSGISVRGGNGICLKSFTIDMDWPNKTCSLPSASSSRGEGILFWNGETPSNDFLADDLLIKRTGHYGLGLQNCEMQRFEIKNCFFEDVGGDPIDIKDYAAYPKSGTISDCSTTRFGLNATNLNGAENPAGFDLRGDVLASNLRITDLNIWIAAGTGAPYTCGVRLNANVDSEGRLGGRKARVHGFSVKSSKADNVGSDTDARIYGASVSESFGALVGGVAENCFRGVVVTKGGNSTPLGTSILAFTAINCKGAAGDGCGVYIGNGCNNTTVQATSVNCDLGLFSDSQANSVDMSFINNTLDHNITENTIRQGDYSFHSAAAIKSNLLRSPANNFKENVTVWAEAKPSISLRSTLNGTWANTDDGVVSFESADTSGAGAAVRAEVRARMTGSSAGGTELAFRTNAGAGLTEPLLIRGTTINMKLLGNYANDAAAATAGLIVGDVYRNGSTLQVRVI